MRDVVFLIILLGALSTVILSGMKSSVISPEAFINKDKSLGYKGGRALEVTLNADGSISDGPFTNMHAALAPLVNGSQEDIEFKTTYQGSTLLYRTVNPAEVTELCSPTERWQQCMTGFILDTIEISRKDKVLAIDIDGNIQILERHVIE